MRQAELEWIWMVLKSKMYSYLKLASVARKEIYLERDLDSRVYSMLSKSAYALFSESLKKCSGFR